MARHRAAMPVFEQAAGGKDKRVFLIRHLHRWDVFQRMKLAFAPGKAVGEEIRRARVMVIPHRRL